LGAGWLTHSLTCFRLQAKRTAFGNFGGKLKNMSATQLGTAAAKAALGSANVGAGAVFLWCCVLVACVFLWPDVPSIPPSVSLICVLPVQMSPDRSIHHRFHHHGQRCTDGTLHRCVCACWVLERAPEPGCPTLGPLSFQSADAAYLARHVGLGAGAPIESTSLTVNRLCGSGFQSLVSGTQEIQLGEAKVALVGGAESMSQAPMSAYGHKVRFGTTLGQDLGLVDTLWAGLTDSYCKTPMGITAENLGEQYNLTRADTDAFGIRSQQAWAAANEAGKFKSEIAPMELKGRRGMETFDTDEGPRPQATIEQLGKLPTVFKKDGVVTAGTASGTIKGGVGGPVAVRCAVLTLCLLPARARARVPI